MSPHDQHKPLSPWWRSRAPRVAGSVSALLLGAIGFLPLCGGPGYEAALAAGLTLPAIAAVATAIEVARRDVAARLAVGRGATTGVALAVVAILVSLLHGLRVGFCDVTEGLDLLVLGPGFGAVLGGALGGLCGWLAPWQLKRRVLLAALCALALPIAGVAVSLWRFWSSPMVFAFDPFFGHFAGPLYDTVVDSVGPLASYRVGTSLTLIALSAGAAHLRHGAHGRPKLVLSRRPARALLGAAALIASLAHCAAGAQLGHWSTSSSIERALGRTLSSARCDLVHSRDVARDDAARLGRECDAHLTQVEAYFGARGPERVRVYLFASSAEKGRLMGAASTYIAKPWRREIYVQASGFPHPVLGHELAHVVAGSFGQGPFRVAGPLGGIVPDPGRIEGVAVAAAPDEDDELTLDEWSRAMRDAKLLPPLDEVFRMTFLGKNSSTAYTVAGAFVHWLHDAYGAEVVRRWYGGAELAALTGGADLAALDEKWRRSLDDVSLDARADETARARFDRPPIFGRRCPRVVDRLDGEANARLNAHDPTGARAEYERLLRLDPHHFWASVGLARCAAQERDFDGYATRLERLTTADDIAAASRTTALETLADGQLADGAPEALRGALSRYGEVASKVVGEGRLRTLEVKRRAAEFGLEQVPGCDAETSELAARAITAFVIGDREGNRDASEATALLGEWSTKAPTDGLPEYLLGRHFLQSARWTAAAAHLDAALARTLPTSRLRREAARLRLVAACALEQPEAARAALSRFRAEPGAPKSQRDGVERFAERCGVK